MRKTHTRAAYFFASVCLAIGLACPFSVKAHAGVEASDIIAGRTAEEQALPLEILPAIEASNAVLMDENGVVWFDRRATEKVQIASLTKVMTAIVASEYLSADELITVSPEAASIREASAGFLQGDAVAFEASLRALLTASGNDAATAIAEAAGSKMLLQQGVPGDAFACRSAFVSAMNQKAGALGLVNSLFTNPHGLDFDTFAQGQYSCAQDVAVLLRQALQDQSIRTAMGFSETSITVVRNGCEVQLPLVNTDVMLREYAGTCAAKTGFTAAAGPCVATAVNRGDGHEYYVIVLNSASKAQRFVDSTLLYDWMYAQREALSSSRENHEMSAQAAAAPVLPAPEYQLFHSTEYQRTVIEGVEANYPVVAKVAHADWPDKTIPATVAEPDKVLTLSEGAEGVEQTVSYDAIAGNVACGDKVGALVFHHNGSVVWETDLLAMRDVAAPSWLESIGLWFQRTFSWLVSPPPPTQSTLLNFEPQKVS